jgi:uncharacterized protein with HEPN domain
MPPSWRDSSYIWDIVDASRLAIDATRDLDFAGYESNRLVQAAVERCIEVIGEAARRLSEDLKQRHPEIPWSKIVGQRNVLAHDYREIQQERIWRIVREELPRLVSQLEPELPALPPPVE